MLTMMNLSTILAIERQNDVLTLGDLRRIHLSDNAAKLTDIVNLHLSAYTVEVLTFIILGISILAHIIRTRSREEDEGFEGLLLPIFTFLFASICVLELIIAVSGINPIWFCNPDKIGWFLSVLGFFAFLFILNNQIRSFPVLMKDLTVIKVLFHGKDISTEKYLTGILSGIIGIVILCGCEYALVGHPGEETVLLTTAFWLVTGVVAVLQIVQAVILCREIETNEHLCFKETFGYRGKVHKLTIRKCVISSVYLVGAFATIVTLMHFMALFIIAIIIVAVTVIVVIIGLVQNSNAGRKEPKVCCYNCKYYHLYGPNGGECRRSNGGTEHTKYINLDHEEIECAYWKCDL
jgi:hypothetical protein